MSREIKFRAWDNKAKEWLMGYELPNLGGFSMFGECMLMEEWSRILSRFILQQKDRNPKDLILMQFTGLKDENRKEIYEGDILELLIYDKCLKATFQQITIVEYLVPEFVLKVVKCQIFKIGAIAQTLSNKLKYKVIGNIQENPDLLK